MNEFYFHFHCFHTIFINNPTLGKHSVRKFEMLNAGVHCMGGLAGNCVTGCLFKEETLFKNSMISNDSE